MAPINQAEEGPRRWGGREADGAGLWSPTGSRLNHKLGACWLRLTRRHGQRCPGRAKRNIVGARLRPSELGSASLRGGAWLKANPRHHLCRTEPRGWSSRLRMGGYDRSG